MCNHFLWKGNLERHHSARVSWETVTLTTAQGGLGVKDMLTWNRACCLRLIWLLFFREDSVWAAWFKEVILNGSIHNYWTINPRQSFSWLVNKLIKLRPDVFPLIKLRVENGRSALFWHHNWAPPGIIADLQVTSRSRIGITSNATVASLCRNGNWNLPPARSDPIIQLYTYITTIELTTLPDFYEWTLLGKIDNKFRTGEVYTHLKGQILDKPWTKSVWFPHQIPRHAFHAWLVLQNRCPTRDRLISWGIQTDPLCLLCNSHGESPNHLYFDCSFSFELWSLVSHRCRIRLHRSWDQSATQLETLTGEKISKLLTLLSWQATLYWIWNERNGRLHAQNFRG